MNKIWGVSAMPLAFLLFFVVHRCRFSQMLAPTFEDAGTKFKEEFPVSYTADQCSVLFYNVVGIF